MNKLNISEALDYKFTQNARQRTYMANEKLLVEQVILFFYLQIKKIRIEGEGRGPHTQDVYMRASIIKKVTPNLMQETFGKFRKDNTQ